MTTSHAQSTRAVVEELLRRIGRGDPERIAELYAEGCDRRLDRPQEEHGRARTPWIRHRSTRADAAAHYRERAAHHVPEGRTRASTGSWSTARTRFGSLSSGRRRHRPAAPEPRASPCT